MDPTLLRKRISADIDGASVVSGSKGGRFKAVDDFDEDDGKSVMSRMSRVTSTSRTSKAAATTTKPATRVPDSEKAAFGHACKDVHEDACKAIVMFVKTSAVQCGAPVGKAFYCFVLKLTRTLFEWARKAKGQGVLLGDVARQLGAYPLLAFHILNELTLHEDPIRRIVELANALDAQLPSSDNKVSIAGRTECTRLAARTVIPFAFGLRNLIPNSRLDFLLRNIDRGELKAVRYSLAFVIRGARESETSSASSSSSESESEEEEQEEPAGAGVGAGAGSEERKASTLPTGPPPKRVQLRDEISDASFMGILSNVPRTHTFELLHAFGLHNPGEDPLNPYPSTHDPALRDKILRGEPTIPPCRGSILRAYVRSVLEVNVDAYEPDIQTLSDCVPAAESE